MLSCLTLVFVAMATSRVAGMISEAKFGVVPTISSPGATAKGPPPSESFPYEDQLSDDYTLYWKFNNTHITFEMVVRTNGWVGFGISPSGAMKSSDVIIGWVKDGQTHFADRHAEGHFLPAKDSSQDWTLLMGQESGEYTVLKVSRPLETCDDSDRPILPGTTRVIFAQSPNDPPSDDAVSYHGSTRGTKSLLLLDPPTSDKQKISLPSDVKTLEFTNRNVSVPSADTTYWCTTWKLPDLGGKHHMIRYEPIIQTGHETLLHHVILYFCDGSLNEATDPAAFHCDRNPLKHSSHCTHVFIAWAIGGKAFNYPSHVGHSLGSAGDPGYFLMETHYDNPRMRSDYVDDSGLRLYLTKELRQHDGGVLMAGVQVSGYQIIPPYEKSFLSQGICDTACISESLGDTEMRVFANVLHAHLLGVKLRTRHFRNGVELPPIQEDNNYDFNYQEARMLESERVIKKGDKLLVECEYDSSQRTQVTHGGLSSREEMCLSFLIYYPRSKLSRCVSRILYEIPDQFAGRSVYDIVHHLDWTDPRSHEGFNHSVAVSPHAQLCHGSHTSFQANLQTISLPKVNNPYQKPQMCHN
ncbi:DBH-like monooxygenase protein 1 [Plakobranchus ocellatus]|uniref:DBH-like monooxygenase protein 1 n=1 Tax=Plakobranchus ocellatus TaxID=259542 RepID=A0AAV4BE23_9GAST|nr:DBH-like monooxygenase protein 1 [Plakobranchus ocellatus]